MYNELFSNAINQIPALPANLLNANKLAAANVEKLTAWQIASFKSYVDLGLERLKAATEVADVKSLQTFYDDQVKVVTAALPQKFLDDSKTLATLSANIKLDFDKLAENSIAQISPNTTKTTKATNRKAA